MADRTMYDAICAGCGCATKVPFQPRPGGKPVLCTPCYRSEKDQEAGRRQQDEADQPRLFDDQAPAARRQPTPPDAQTTALAVRSVGRSEVLSLAPNRSVEIAWMEVQVEPAMTYKVGTIKTPDGRWIDQMGVLSNFWDFVGQLKGLSFQAPVVLEHTQDRVVVEVTAHYLNQQGRPISDTEIYEIDCARLREVDRLKFQGQGVEDTPKYDPDTGQLIGWERKLPVSAEREIWSKFLEMQRHKMAKAITCAHRRLIQRAVGTKTLSAGALKMQFPVIRERFTDAQIHEAVASIYGDEDADLMASPESGVVEAEIVDEPGPAPDLQPPTAQPAPAATTAAVQDEEGERKELYRKIFGIGKKCGDGGEDAVRERLAEWKCCAVDETGRPSLRASTIQQVRDAAGRYERLLQDLEQSDQVAF